MELIEAVKINKEVKTRDEIRRFFGRESMHKVMRSVLTYIVKGQDIGFNLNIGGGSFMSKDAITVGLPESFFNESYEVMYLALVTLLGHEGQHKLSSDLGAFTTCIEEESDKLVRKGMSKNFAKNFVHSVLNIVEDGRIENILVNRLPGYIPKIQFLNMYFWDRAEITEETSEFHALTSTMLSLSVLGIYPKNYNNVFKGTKLDKEVDKIKPLIEKGVKARTCEDCFNICREIIKIIEPYLFELYEKIKEKEELMEKIMEFLRDFQDDLSDCEETELNDSGGQSSHIEIPSNKEEPEGEKGDDQEGFDNSSSADDSSEESDDESQGSDGEEDDDELTDNEEESSSKQKKDDDDSSDKEDKTTDSGDNESDDDSEDEALGDSKDDEKEKSDDTESEQDKKDDNSESEKDNSSKSDEKEKGNKENENEKEKSEQETRKLSEGINPNAKEEDFDALTLEIINEKMKEIFEELKGEADDKLKDIEKDEVIRAKSEESKNYKLTQEDIDEITKKHRGHGFQEIPNNFPLTHSLPNEIKIPAKKFRKEIEKIFKNRSMMNINGQNKGVLNVNDLYKVGISDYNIFTIEGSKSQSDHVIYILRDGSGSMHGEKEVSSAYALSIIEEGLRGIVPFKTSTFCASRYITHFTVRDWNDKSKKNYAYNYLQHRGVNGGNEDGYSIAVATKELLKRPERDKILIVLSDGLPSSIKDTKEAIKEARRNKIHLVGIMFGSEEFRKNNFEDYKEMYQKNIIATAPSNIPNRLTKVLKQILSR